MNIEIGNDQIERMVQLAIQAKVDQWFKDNENKYVMRDMLREYVKAFVQHELSMYSPDMKALGKEVQADRFAEQLTAGIAEAIAVEFCDRYS